MVKTRVTKLATSTSLEPIYQLWGWIVIVWALYRYFFHLPEWADEFIFKPFVFLFPVIWYVRTREKRSLESLGITTKNIFTSIYIGLGIGFVFSLEGIMSNVLKYGKVELLPNTVFEQFGIGMMLLLSFATAVSEEVLSRGFVFSRLFEKDEEFVVFRVYVECDVCVFACTNFSHWIKASWGDACPFLYHGYRTSGCKQFAFL